MLKEWRLPAPIKISYKLPLRAFLALSIIVAVRYILLHTLISDDCICIDNHGRRHNFCYKSSANPSVVGKKFSCTHLRKLEDLGLLNNYSADVSYDSDPVFVTAFSQSHFMEGKRLIASIRAFHRKAKILVYDLGLTKKNAEQVKRWCNVEYRRFAFEQHQPYFSLLHTFRWKPVVIAEALRDYKSIWYMDTSVILTKGDLRHVYDLIDCRQWSKTSVSVPSSPLRDLRESLSRSNRSWDTVQWTANLRECRKSAYLLHSFSGHGTYVATDPSLYAYFPISLEEISKPKAKMFEAGLVYVVRQNGIIEKVLKWSVLCALQEDCMGTRIIPNICQFNQSDLYSTFAHCHRYDQSVVNVLLADAYHYDRHYYTSEITDFFRIQRFISRPVRNRELKCSYKMQG